MPSPFPGMDPYLENSGLWRDFHQRFITMLADALLPALPDDYDARSEEQIRLVEVPPRIPQEYRPDIGVYKPRAPKPHASTSTSGGAAVLERPPSAAVTVRTPAFVERRETWIEIIRRSDRELVTVIEVLSPTNKTGVGLSDYRAKRLDLIYGGVNLVEIDLLLTGQRPAELAEPLPSGDFYAVVSRAEKFSTRGGECEVYAWQLRDVLPPLAVPLRPPTAEVAVNLAEVFNTTYDRGRYARALDYDALPQGIGEGEKAWAREIAEKAGLLKR